MSAVLCCAVFSTVRADGYGHAEQMLMADSLDAWESRVAQNLQLNRVSKGGGSKSAPEKGAAKGDAQLESGVGLGRRRPPAPQSTYERSVQGLNSTGANQLESLLGVLAWMDRPNIRPEEFPAFKLESIPKYRETAKNIIAALGLDAIPRLVQELITPPTPPPNDYIKLVPTHQQDLLDVWGRIGSVPPDLQVPSDQVMQWLRTVMGGILPPDRKARAASVLLQLLPTEQLKKAPPDKEMEELLAKELVRRMLEGDPKVWAPPGVTGQLRTLLHDDPSSFLALREHYPRDRFQALNRTFDELLRGVLPSDLKKWYKATGDAAYVRLLLERPGGVQLLDPADVADPLIGALLREMLEDANVAAEAAANILSLRKPSVEELKRLMASGMRGEKIGAYCLLLKEHPTAETAWLVRQFKALPADAAAAMSKDLAERVGDAPSDVLIEVLRLENEKLRSTAASKLLERIRQSDIEHRQLRSHQTEIVAAFEAQNPKNVEMISLLAALRSKPCLGALIGALTDVDPKVWQPCRNELCKINPKGVEEIGPANSADPASRATAQARWREWLKEYQEPH